MVRATEHCTCARFDSLRQKDRAVLISSRPDSKCESSIHGCNVCETHCMYIVFNPQEPQACCLQNRFEDIVDRNTLQSYEWEGSTETALNSKLVNGRTK
jgi:hypothetical protein